MKLLQIKALTLILLFMSAVMISGGGCSKNDNSNEPAGPVEPPQQPPPPDSTTKARNPRVKLETTLGDIIIELNQKAAPVTVENFLQYVNEGFYNGTLFHRVMVGFLIQSGGVTLDLKFKRLHDPIISEADNGLKNARGSIAMHHDTDKPDSATAMFFFNCADSPYLDRGHPQNPDGYGYTVFGAVVEGMNVVDKIAAVPVSEYNSYFQFLPIDPVVLVKAAVIQ